MFGDITGMMGKIKATQEKMEATKKRLDTVLINEKSTDGLLEITITANRLIRTIQIDNELLNNKDQLEIELVTLINKAIAKATAINEVELSALAKEGMPTIPGMDFFK
ncbi:YbaB/EbfC family nucleoid-associated protein [Flavobacterium sp.]|uniref:YbaB/EbfC family nucleoid-associated protein n=1 Tax=Flavobacterium sp. TaxID=239 RepID=UPI00261AC784|nr:YbaB/EbfC family nucleoid-associated protein [Flavobacterium sp.]